MPDNRPQTWYDGIPRSENKWDHFSADRLKGNEIRNGDVILAKIPKIPGLISRRTKKDGSYAITYIELILSHSYDKDKKQSRNKRVIIGTESRAFPGMMIINDKYHNYFDTKGNLVWQPEEKMKEPKKPTEEKEPTKQQQQAKQQDKQEQPKQTEQITLPQNQPGLPAEQDRLTEQEPEEADGDDWDEDYDDMDEEDEFVQMLNQTQRKKDRVEFLNSILIEYKNTIDEQAKRRPDKPLTLYQIRRINELLAELKELLSEYDTGTYLQLAEEPEENNPNTADNTNHKSVTYADMAIILSVFYCTMFSYRTHRLWIKPKKENKTDVLL